MANNNSNSNGNNTDRELDRFKEILNNKIDEKKDLIFPSHSRAYNNNLQREIHCLEWVLGQATTKTKTDQRQMQMSQVEGLVQKEINDLKEKMTKSIDIEKRDMFITYTETLNWILYVIHSIDEKGLHWKLTT